MLTGSVTPVAASRALTAAVRRRWDVTRTWHVTRGTRWRVWESWGGSTDGYLQKRNAISIAASTSAQGLLSALATRVVHLFPRTRRNPSPRDLPGPHLHRRRQVGGL